MSVLRNRPFVTSLVLALVLSVLGAGTAAARRGPRDAVTTPRPVHPVASPYSGEPDVSGQGIPQPVGLGGNGSTSVGSISGMTSLWAWVTAKIWLSQHPRKS